MLTWRAVAREICENSLEKQYMRLNVPYSTSTKRGHTPDGGACPDAYDGSAEDEQGEGREIVHGDRSWPCLHTENVAGGQ